MIIKQSHIAQRAEAAAVARRDGVDADSAAARVIAAHAGWTARAESVAPRASPNATDDWIRRPRTSDWTALRQTTVLAALQSDEHVRPGYDLCAYLAQRSALAYLPKAALTREIEKDTGVTPARFHRWTDIAYCYRLGDTAVIVFRGTVVWNPVQWLHSNLLIVPVGFPARHLGFRLAWGRMRAEIVAWLAENLAAGGDVIIAGHSLGGAMALLAAYDLAPTYRVRAVVTIGAPRVGLGRFRDDYLERPCGRIGDRAITLGQVTQRLTHEDDLISRIPPPPIFRHVGDALRLDAGGRVLPGESQTTLSRILRSIDGGIGWVYREIDRYRTRALAPPPPRNPFARPGQLHVVKVDTPAALDRAGVLGKASGINRANGAFGTGSETSASERFVDDVLKAQRIYPFLSLVSAQAACVGLAVASSAVAVAVFILGCFDLRSHKSGLYVDAFMTRYRTEHADSRTGLPASSLEAVRRAFGQADDPPPAMSMMPAAAIALTAGGVLSLFWSDTTGWIRFYPLIAGPAVFLLARLKSRMVASLAIAVIAGLAFVASPPAITSIAAFLQIAPGFSAVTSSGAPALPHDVMFLMAFVCLASGGIARAADSDAGGLMTRAGAVLFLVSLFVPLGPGRAAAIAAIEPFSLMFGGIGIRGSAMLVQVVLLALASIFFLRRTSRGDVDAALGFVVGATTLAVIAGIVPMASGVSGFVTLAQAVFSVVKAAVGPGAVLYLVVAGLANMLLARVSTAPPVAR